MKKVISILCCMFSILAISQEKSIVDSVAINVLDQMGATIGQLKSCTFQLSRAIDKVGMFGLEKHFYKDDVTMVGPDRMRVKTRNSVHNRDYYYNGEKFVYYSLDENNYNILETSGNIINMIDSIHTKFGFKFPAVDVFYPSLTDDLIEQFSSIVYQGEDSIQGVLCDRILASNQKMNVQLWVTKGDRHLPKQIVIIHKDDKQQQYLTTFENWQIDPTVAMSIFDFTPPADAKNISILLKP